MPVPSPFTECTTAAVGRSALPPRNSQNEARPHAAGMQSRFVALFAGLGVVAVTLAVVVVSHNG